MKINEEKVKIQKEAYKALKKNNFNGGVILPTGCGKTKVLIDCLLSLPDDYTILYCCDNTELRDVDFPNELKVWNAEHLIPRITKKCYQAAYRMHGEYYDIICMDEGDFAITPQYIKVLENNKFSHKLFVSATLESDKKEKIEEYLDIVYEKKISQIEGKGIVNEASLYVVNFMLTNAENKRYLSYNEVFKKILNAKNPNAKALDAVTRNRKHFLSNLDSSRKVCQRLMATLYKESEKNKILIFCGLSEQADLVCKYSYHSKNSKDSNLLELFNNGTIRVLVVIGKIDRGKNLKGINKVIFESPFQSSTKMIQKSGRARRLEVDEISDFYFLCPFYRTHKGEVRETIVGSWIRNSTKDFNKEIKIFKI